MKFIKVTDLSQTFSFLEREKPTVAWAFSLRETQPKEKIVHGIPQHVLETLVNESHGWTGWGFNNNEPWLLFETHDDAVFARLRFGEITNVN